MAVKQISVRLEEGLIKEVKMRCLERDITLQKAVSLALENWIKENGEQND